MIYSIRAEVQGIPYTFPAIQIPQPLHATIESYIQNFERTVSGGRIIGYQAIDDRGIAGPTVTTTTGPTTTKTTTTTTTTAGDGPGTGVMIAGLVLLVWLIWG